MSGFTERDIPADLIPKARAWFDREMHRLELVHGEGWPNVRDWLADYLNAELRERAHQAQGGNRE